ncbi:MAG TPA: hypothetical protein VFW28_19075 [Micropepsaceae bacterium]|nr:hypothetical protein [Micropepsaceae bacterium]
MILRFAAAALVSGLSFACIPDVALAWGASGYRLIGELASQSLPSDIPEFLRTPEAGRQIAEVARQPDWSKGAGDPHDVDSDPANYVLVGDDLKISGGPLLSALPANREAYDAALRDGGSDQYRAGYLPYAIIEGWQQLSLDLAYWRADVAGARWAKTPDERSWFLKNQYVREGLTIRDAGYLAHLVANGGQPMNVSVHANGWGNYPNPQKFSTTKDLRAQFEGTVVRSHITEKDITGAMAPYRDCRCAIQRRVSDYLLATQKQVVTLYRVEKSRGLAGDTTGDRSFVVTRLAAATSQLRDIILDAWRVSETFSVGSPALAVRDIEAGKTNAFGSMRGND